MFVKNKTNVDFTYRKGTYAAVLKANSVTFVDENKVTARELINCYGQRISVISQEETQYTEEVRVLPPVKKEVKGVEEITIDKKQLNDDCIEDLLRQVNEEISKVEGAETKTETTEDTVEGAETTKDTVEGGTETTEDTVEGGNDTINAEGDANTGIEEIDNFLNGKTDELPEGTEVITEEEAKVLEGTETTKDTVEGGTTEGTETKTETKKSTRGRRKNK